MKRKESLRVYVVCVRMMQMVIFVNASKRVAVVARVFTLTGIFAMLFCSLSCSPRGYSGEPVSITFGGLASDANVLLFVAEDQGFFTKNGIILNFKVYGTGVETTNDLLNNKIDIAGAAEFPIVARAFQQNDISIIASICKSNNVYLIGLVDKGIGNLVDIKGKKIGLPFGTIMEFYLSRYLSLNGMSVADVTLINIAPGQSADSITGGSLDAVVAWEPYISQIRESYSKEIVSWSVQSNQANYALSICRNDWIEQHPDLVKRFLNSLAQAQEFVERHPDEAKVTLKRRFVYLDEQIAKAWMEHQYSLSLDQSLIVAMEDEARWSISNNLTAEKTVPDFMNYIHVDGLKAVKPEAVNIR